MQGYVRNMASNMFSLFHSRAFHLHIVRLLRLNKQTNRSWGCLAVWKWIAFCGSVNHVSCSSPRVCTGSAQWATPLRRLALRSPRRKDQHTRAEAHRRQGLMQSRGCLAVGWVSQVLLTLPGPCRELPWATTRGLHLATCWICLGQLDYWCWAVVGPVESGSRRRSGEARPGDPMSSSDGDPPRSRNLTKA